RDTFALFADEFPVLVKLAACRRLMDAVGPEAAALAAWLDAGQKWLSSLHKEDRERCAAFAEALAPLQAARQGRDPAALQLLLAWLQSPLQPGPVGLRLRHAARAWTLAAGRDDLADAAHELAEFAYAGKWGPAAETAAELLRRLGPPSAVCWSAEGE